MRLIYFFLLLQTSLVFAEPTDSKNQNKSCITNLFEDSGANTILEEILNKQPTPNLDALVETEQPTLLEQIMGDYAVIQAGGKIPRRSIEVATRFFKASGTVKDSLSAVEELVRSDEFKRMQQNDPDLEDHTTSKIRIYWQETLEYLDGKKLEGLDERGKSKFMKEFYEKGLELGFDTKLEMGFLRFLRACLRSERQPPAEIQNDRGLDLAYHILGAYKTFARYSSFGLRESFLNNLAAVFYKDDLRSFELYSAIFHENGCPCSPPNPTHDRRYKR